jgi:hypothetical protein
VDDVDQRGPFGNLLLTQRLAKTEAGRAELKASTHGLQRPVRNLLFIVDGAQPVGHWLAGARNTTLDDVLLLIELELIELVKEVKPPPPPAPPPPPPAAPAPAASAVAGVPPKDWTRRW